MQRRVGFSVGDEKLVGDLHLPDSSRPPFPCIVLSHGYMSNRSGEKHFQISYRFPLEGIAVLRFDHRNALNGESQGQFEDTTLTRRVEDLAAALDYLESAKEIDASRIGLLGSSLGGTTILALPLDERVKAIALLSTPIAFPQPRMEVRESIVKNGYYQYPGGPRIKKAFFDDLAMHDLKETVKKISCPLLIIHGDLDEQVPRHQAFVLYHLANQPKEIKLIAGADHAFTDLDKLNVVLGITLDWFKKYLTEQP